MCKFYDVTRRLLQERLDKILAGIMPVVMMLREFWYYCRNVFLKENPELDEIDSKAKKPYENWSGTIVAKWLIDNAAGPLGTDLQYLPGVTYDKSMHINDKKECLWTRIRDAMYIFPKATAQCIGIDRPFLVDRNTRKYVTKDRSLILVCEKTTVIEKLLARLKEEGYRINIVGTAGCTQSQVVETVIEIAAEMIDKRTNFWVLHLHDYDVKGLEIYFKLKERARECLIDVGVNREFVDYLKADHEIEMRLIEETVVVKTYNKKLQRWIAQGDSAYSEEDFNYLQGTPFKVKGKEGKMLTHYRAKRIEIDPIEIEFGIDVFIGFILAKIKESCRVWDLRRIGVEDFYLEEPDNLFEEAVDDWIIPIKRKYSEVYGSIREPDRRIQRIVKEALESAGVEEEFNKIRDEHWSDAFTYEAGGFSVSGLKDLDGLKEVLGAEWNREWATQRRYTDELAKVNDQIEYFEGDVREGKNVLRREVGIIQGQLESDQQDAFDEAGFHRRLRDVDWGEKALDKLEVPDGNALIDRAIAALELLREEIDN